MEPITAIIASAPTVIVGISAILTGLATIAAVTPTEKDDNAIHRLQNVWTKLTMPLLSLLGRGKADK